MKINSITLDEDELPSDIAVTMTIAEAVMIAKYVGNLTPTTDVSQGLYSALVGGVINRFWDDGLEHF